jgi:hypothetical protein
MKFIIAAVLAGVLATGCAVEPTTAPITPKPSGGAGEQKQPTSAEPSGKVSGTCDYDLGSGLGSDYSFTAEADVDNTGSGGIVVVVKVSWPQFGRSPVKASKKVHVAEDKTATVRFSKHATMSQVTALQSWQERHDFDDGCKYAADIVDTFETVDKGVG